MSTKLKTDYYSYMDARGLLKRAKKRLELTGFAPRDIRQLDSMIGGLDFRIEYLEKAMEGKEKNGKEEQQTAQV